MTRSEDVALPFSPLLRLVLLRRTLRRRDRWTRAELVQYQARSLATLRAHAYARSPFYQRHHAGLAGEPLERLPILTKTDLMAHWDDVVTDRSLRLDDVRRFVETLATPFLFRGEYVVSTTSGSTGLKGVFAFGRDEWLRGLASHGRATDWAGAGIGLLHRLRMAIVSSRKPWCKSLLVGASVDSPLIPTMRLDSTDPLLGNVERLNAFRPQILVAHAETAKALAQRQVEGDLRIAPRMVFASSEVLTSPSRRAIVDAWGTEPFNAYAATETALMAADCQLHRMHVCEDLVIAEVVDRHNRPVSPGTYGEKLLVSVLFSRTIPLIRYEISDSVALADPAERCECGKPFRLLVGIRGRMEDTMHLAGDGGTAVPIPPDVFHDVLEPAPIGGWQVVQGSATGIVVRVVGPQVAFSGEDLAQRVRRRLIEQGARDPVVRIEVVESLRQSPTGKTPLVAAQRGGLA
jgi:phenylacetate-CoA ligase